MLASCQIRLLLLQARLLRRLSRRHRQSHVAHLVTYMSHPVKHKVLLRFRSEGLGEVEEQFVFDWARHVHVEMMPPPPVRRKRRACSRGLGQCCQG